MYCIFHLPRTGSHYLHSLIISSLIFIDPRHFDTKLEEFNPAFNTVETVWEKYYNFSNNDPVKSVKMVINHYPELADKFIENEKYKTIFIKPKNYRKRLLKALVEKQMGTYSNGTDRKNVRENCLKSMEFSDEMILERFQHYKIHMSYENKCNYVFLDENIFESPEKIMKTLNLPFVSTRYKRVAPYYSDIEMLKDYEKFNDQYNKISLQLFNKII